ncbi:MAG: DHHW family protein [Clostridia bacterium]
MRKKVSFVITLWWLIALGALGGCLLIFTPHDAVASPAENRMLAAFPSINGSNLTDTKFADAFETFLSDKMFLRPQLVHTGKRLLSGFSILTVDELLTNNADDFLIDEVQTDSAHPTRNDYDPASIPIPQLAPDSSLSMQHSSYTGQSQVHVWLHQTDGSRTALLTYSIEDVRHAASVLTAYADVLPSGGTLHVMLVPKAQTANQLILHPDTASSWSSELEDALLAFVDKRVVIHSAVDILLPHIQNNESIYFRTDHHWTPLAGFYAVSDLLSDMPIPKVPLDAYSFTPYEGFLGSIYLQERSDKLKVLADTVEVVTLPVPAKQYWISNFYRKGEYPVIDDAEIGYKKYLSGTHGPWRVLDGGYQTGRNALVICDSFGNVVAPFLAPYYDGVYMVDFRDNYYTRAAAGGSAADYIKRMQISDVFIVLSDSNSVDSYYMKTLLPENLT